MLKNSIFQVKFDNSVKEYNKVDGILAIAYFFYMIAFTVLYGLLMFHTNFVKQLFALRKIPTKAIFTVVLYIPIVLIEAGPVFIILKCRKQVYLYTRDNNILAPVVAHAIVDFIPSLFSGM